MLGNYRLPSYSGITKVSYLVLVNRNKSDFISTKIGIPVHHVPQHTLWHQNWKKAYCLLMIATSFFHVNIEECNAIKKILFDFCNLNKLEFMVSGNCHLRLRNETIT